MQSSDQALVGASGMKSAVDLYTDDLNRISGQDLYEAIRTFTRISEPLSARPREGYALDFKEEWSDRALHTVVWIRSYLWRFVDSGCFRERCTATRACRG